MNAEQKTKKRIAIIGSGISGQTCGYLLSQKHQITLFEAESYLGGHTATVDIDIDNRTIPIDTGFIVFNDRTYPNFIKLMNQIGIKYQDTEMSFSVQNSRNELEYNGHNLNTLFSQRRNLLNPRFYRLVFEILKFNNLAKAANRNKSISDKETLGQFLKRHGFSDYFSNNYILPMMAAIWSSSIEGSKNFPLKFFLRFFNNHGLLDISDRPQWHVIKGGSRSYIKGLTSNIQEIRINTPVQSVKRRNDFIEIVSKDQAQFFDEVVFACHSDQALALINDATDTEKKILGAIQYRKNDVVLHTDSTLLPTRKKSHASWNYRLGSNQGDLPTLTYKMNILQNIDSDKNICVSLNQTADIDTSKILRKFSYAHPIFSLESIAAQEQRHKICGIDKTHFCGAYWYNGFHEDGVNSALDVCKRFGLSLDGPSLPKENKR